MTEDIEEKARASVEAFNRGDWDAVRATLAPGYIYEETGTNERYEGPDAVIAALQDWKTAFPDATGEIVRIATCGETSILEIVWHGTHFGPIDTGAGVLPPSGRAGSFWAVMWQEWDDGLLVHERHHIDLLTMLANIGAVPAPA
ncbi:ester cyclase [Actinomycetospora sp. TBRC 11914]|uniref:ester cyclase n=1 Tax=Actinomycetospora sp. TBRC 11914 TaxID=2729387 RepID=UPI00145E27DA|nr:ester cyclase [Actinomycetospora sp. TBRC 11914]NMO88946.1 ester cyclase [Actinomycetospora sp. TBRC 11914]